MPTPNTRPAINAKIDGLMARIRELQTELEAPISFLLTTPVIYGIPRVPRGDHFIYDRALLHYLNWIERMNYLYCSYANGLMSYAREIVARTKQYWCPIKHARRLLDSHAHNAKFFDYGDAERYRRELERLRRDYPELRGD